MAHDDTRLPHPDGSWYDRALGTAGQTVGYLGGWPQWVQAYPKWPRCCQKPMFFVARIDMARFGGVDTKAYGFLCECGAGAQMVQFT